MRSPRVTTTSVTAVPDAATSQVAASADAAESGMAVASGRLIIRAISPEDVQAVSVVITRAFAASAEAVRLDDVNSDIQHALQAPAGDGGFLIARLFPADPSLLPPGQASRLVGTATLSLDTEAAQPLKRLPPVNRPPTDKSAAYVSNMAVDAKFRRQGIARGLLRACEDAARAAGKREVWLHVREADAAARALYAACGYAEVAKDAWLDTIRHNLRPRILMRRWL